MTDTTPALLSAHIRARLAKSTLDSPAINISKAGWEMILGLLDAQDWISPDKGREDGPGYIISAPYPDGHPYRGEGSLGEDGRWYWSNGLAVERPVTAILPMPMPPKGSVA